MSKTIYKIIPVAILLISCSPVDVIKPMGSKTAPAKVVVRDVVNGPGNAILYYNLPNDENLKYVKAVYSPRSGEEVSINASAFTDSLVLDGFKDEGTYDVKLYSVSFGETCSEPVRLKVNPLTPPYKAVASGLECVRAFGGVQVSFSNPTGANLSVSVHKEGENGEWEELDTYYTSEKHVKFAVRGQEPVESKFKVYVSDHWGDVAESREYLLTPMFEVLCDKSLFAGLRPAGDNWEITMWGGASNNNSLACAFDGSYSRSAPIFQTKSTGKLPVSFTIDMGREYVLSRYKFYPCQGFKAGHPRKFQIWGATELNPDASVVLVDALGNQDPYWTLLGEFESFRPSGATVSATVQARTDDDVLLCQNGEEWEFPVGIQPVRYARIRVLTTWDGVQYIEYPEIDFFGTPADK